VVSVRGCRLEANQLGFDIKVAIQIYSNSLSGLPNPAPRVKDIPGEQGKKNLRRWLNSNNLPGRIK